MHSRSVEGRCCCVLDNGKSFGDHSSMFCRAVYRKSMSPGPLSGFCTVEGFGWFLTAVLPILCIRPSLGCQVCADCPAHMLPFHVKAVPDLTCEAATSLAGDAPMGAAWGGAQCPSWCYQQEVLFLSNTKDVRMCPLEDSHRRS